MKVKINGKIFKARYKKGKQFEKEGKEFEIRKGLDMFDLMFFKEWFFRGNNDTKVNFREDIPFVSKIAYGKYVECFPCEVGENYVIFVYNRIQSSL